VRLALQADGVNIGTLIIVLRADIAPRASENFRGLCTGEYGIGGRSERPLKLEGTEFFRILPGQFAVGGDFEVRAFSQASCHLLLRAGFLAQLLIAPTVSKARVCAERVPYYESQNGDGTGGECVFKPGRGALPNGCLPDESFLLRHMGPGAVSLAAHNGPDSGASCFNITFAACPLLDERAVVFGFVVQGHDALAALQLAGDRHGWPTKRVVISACGQVSGDGTAQPAAPRRLSAIALPMKTPAASATASHAATSEEAHAAQPAATSSQRKSASSGSGEEHRAAEFDHAGSAGSVPLDPTRQQAHYTLQDKAWPTGPGPKRWGEGAKTVAELKEQGTLPKPQGPLAVAARAYAAGSEERTNFRAGTGAAKAAGQGHSREDRAAAVEAAVSAVAATLDREPTAP
jgi:cyclophilin family peptidyl-prolyl cis-trans isomerase